MVCGVRRICSKLTVGSNVLFALTTASMDLVYYFEVSRKWRSDNLKGRPGRINHVNDIWQT